MEDILDLDDNWSLLIRFNRNVNRNINKVLIGRANAIMEQIQLCH